MLASDLAKNAYHAAQNAIADLDYDMARAALHWARRADSGNPLYIHAEGMLAHRTGAYHEADRLYRRVADLAERSFGAGHIRTVAIYDRIIGLYDEMDRGLAADELRHRIIDGLDRGSAADAGIRALDRIADICLQAGRSADALSIYEAALARRRQVFGDAHPRVSECLVKLTRLRIRIRRIAEAMAARETPPAIRPEIVWRRGEEADSILSV